MTDHDMKTKLEVLHETAGTTLDKLVRVVDPKPGGRWVKTKIEEAEAKVAHAPHHPHSQHHPQSPYGSAWPNPLEPPLGYSIEAVPDSRTVSGLPLEALQPQPLLASPVAADAADVSSLSSANSVDALPTSPPVAAHPPLSKGIRRI
jgi:hypothetical protein